MPWRFKITVLFLASLNPVLLQAQAEDAELSSVFRSMEAALQTPDLVETLILRRKKLDAFPAELVQFTNLKVLDLAHNRIERLPDSLAYLNKLETLILKGNKIDSLPPSIGDLIHLKHLDLGDNEVYLVPDELGNLKELETLQLWSNNLYYLPNSMTELYNLKEVDLRGIQLTEEYQQSIQSVLPDGVTIRFSMTCNCD